MGMKIGLRHNPPAILPPTVELIAYSPNNHFNCFSLSFFFDIQQRNLEE